MIKNVIEDLFELGTSRILVGNLKYIRENNRGAKTNSMIHNFWSFNYIVQRIKEVAEEYRMKVEEINEYGTSSSCPFCDTKGSRRRRVLLYCPRCNKTINADVVGALNITKKDGTIIPSPSWRDRDNGLMTQPLLLRWNEMKWDRKSGMKNQLMKTLEVRIPQASAVGVSI
ncbi:MAG: putative transposase DNA-binding domain protein [Candidatus Bathyarchaeota archaeon BA1]|nr:MAG: putative transposase DNA-binding domain protein [Candidatus Bathyarchaeota archaeon BA1]